MASKAIIPIITGSNLLTEITDGLSIFQKTMQYNTCINRKLTSPGMKYVSPGKSNKISPAHASSKAVTISALSEDILLERFVKAVTINTGTSSPLVKYR